MTGEEAVKIALEEEPDLILLDLMLPVKDGASGILLQGNSNAKLNTPIIMLTAKDTELDKVLDWKWVRTITLQSRLERENYWRRVKAQLRSQAKASLPNEQESRTAAKGLAIHEFGNRQRHVRRLQR